MSLTCSTLSVILSLTCSILSVILSLTCSTLSVLSLTCSTLSVILSLTCSILSVILSLTCSTLSVILSLTCSTLSVHFEGYTCMTWKFIRSKFYETHVNLYSGLYSSTNKTDRHDKTEKLLKVAINTITPHPHVNLRYIHKHFDQRINQ